ncbi:MAG: type II toxin-antitoxin system RelE/ParE family toxin [Woeseia sp.]
MYTVVETPVYTAKVEKILTDDEREAFAAFIARNPQAGSVVRGSGGIRKVRWARKGQGKRGGTRVIYYNRLDKGEIWLLTLYAKSNRSTIPAHELKLIKEVMDRDQEKGNEPRGR